MGYRINPRSERIDRHWISHRRHRLRSAFVSWLERLEDERTWRWDPPHLTFERAFSMLLDTDSWIQAIHERWLHELLAIYFTEQMEWNDAISLLRKEINSLLPGCWVGYIYAGAPEEALEYIDSFLAGEKVDLEKVRSLACLACNQGSNDPRGDKPFSQSVAIYAVGHLLNAISTHGYEAVESAATAVIAICHANTHDPAKPPDENMLEMRGYFKRVFLPQLAAA